MPQSLAERLAPIIKQYEATHADHYQRLIDFLVKIDQLKRRLTTGDTAPDFALPASDGKVLWLSNLVRERPIVLVFIRGGWCPYCYEQINALNDSADQFEEAGVSLVAITPEVAGRTAKMSKELNLTFPVLSDVDSGVALAYGCLFMVPAEDREFLKSHGVDLDQHYGSGAWFMPLASAFVIGVDGIIQTVFGNEDPRVRPEPDQLLSSVLGSSSSKD